MKTEVTNEELAEALEMNRIFARKLGASLGMEDDLESAGRYGVAMALQGYQREKGSFLTYCRWFVRKYVILERKNILTAVKLPSNTYEAAERAPVELLEFHPAREAREPDYEELYAALESLDTVERAILEQFHFQNLSYDEIGRNLKASPVAIGFRIRKARKHLAARMREKKLYKIAESTKGERL